MWVTLDKVCCVGIGLDPTSVGLHSVGTKGSKEVEDGDRVGWALRISWRLCGLAGIKVTG